MTRVKITILFGLICGLAFMPARLMLMQVASPGVAFNLTLWMILTAYALLLTLWAGRGALTAVFTMGLALVAAGAASGIGFFLPALCALSWIRSGLLFRSRMTASIAAEAVTGFGGAAVVWIMAPHTAAGWALAVWLFFLAQSLYFVLFRRGAAAGEGEAGPADRFDQAARRAEALLEG